MIKLADKVLMKSEALLEAYINYKAEEIKLKYLLAYQQFAHQIIADVMFGLFLIGVLYLGYKLIIGFAQSEIARLK